MDVNKMLDIAVGFIAPEESFKSTPYWDENGLAIGYGNHYYADGSAVQEGDTITKSDAQTLLRTVALGKYNSIKNYITADVNEYQAAALTSLAYNCGEGVVRKSRVLSLINAGASEDEISDAYDETCITASGKYNANLYKRRLAEIKLFFTSAKEYLQANPELSIGTGLVIFGLLTYSIIRAAKIKK